MAGTIQRTSDGVPIFDGSPELLTLYREEAVQYLMTFEYKKRYLAGPRLVKELQGTAKTAVRNMTLRNPQWVSHPRGVFVLLEHLEGVVAKPSLVEASRFIMKYFYGLQRKKFETMTSWITRHSEALWEASQSLRKVQKEYGPRTKAESSQGWHDHGPRSGVPSQTGSVSGDPGPFRDDGRMTRRTLGTMAGGKGNIRIGELRDMATTGGQTGVTNLGIPRNTNHQKAGTPLLKCSYQSS